MRIFSGSVLTTKKDKKGKKHMRMKEFRRQKSEDRIKPSAFILTSDF
jgi:hypothetical protein